MYLAKKHSKIKNTLERASMAADAEDDDDEGRNPKRANSTLIESHPFSPSSARARRASAAAVCVCTYLSGRDQNWWKW